MHIRTSTVLLLLFGCINIVIGGIGAWVSYFYVIDFDSKSITEKGLSKTDLDHLRANSDIAKSNVILSNVVFWLGIFIAEAGGIFFLVDYQDHILGFFDDGGADSRILYR